MDDDDKVMAVLDIKGDDGVDEGEVAEKGWNGGGAFVREIAEWGS